MGRFVIIHKKSPVKMVEMPIIYLRRRNWLKLIPLCDKLKTAKIIFFNIDLVFLLQNK